MRGDVVAAACLAPLTMGQTSPIESGHGSSLLCEAAGSTATEFALVAPAFLMFLFLILDGGRMMFAKQALNELAAATARCWAIKATGCGTTAETQSWAVARGAARSMLSIVSTDVLVSPSMTSCNGQNNMAKATISMTFRKGALLLLPQSSVPSQLSSTACFPVAST